MCEILNRFYVYAYVCVSAPIFSSTTSLLFACVKINYRKKAKIEKN